MFTNACVKVGAFQTDNEGRVIRPPNRRGDLPDYMDWDAIKKLIRFQQGPVFFCIEIKEDHSWFQFYEWKKQTFYPGSVLTGDPGDWAFTAKSDVRRGVSGPPADVLEKNGTSLGAVLDNGLASLLQFREDDEHIKLFYNPTKSARPIKMKACKNARVTVLKHIKDLNADVDLGKIDQILQQLIPKLENIFEPEWGSAPLARRGNIYEHKLGNATDPLPQEIADQIRQYATKPDLIFRRRMLNDITRLVNGVNAERLRRVASVGAGAGAASGAASGAATGAATGAAARAGAGAGAGDYHGAGSNMFTEHFRF